MNIFDCTLNANVVLRYALNWIVLMQIIERAMGQIIEQMNSNKRFLADELILNGLFRP